MYVPVAVSDPGVHVSHYHVSLSFLTVTSDPAPPAEPPPAVGAPAAPGPAPAAAFDAAAAAAVPSMVETSPCMKAHGGLLGELSNGQRSPLGQYTSPSPRRLWMYTLVHGKQNLVVGNKTKVFFKKNCRHKTNRFNSYLD